MAGYLLLCGVFGTAAVLCLGLVRSIFGKRLSPTVMTVLWLLAGLRFLLPAALPLTEIFPERPIPGTAEISVAAERTEIEPQPLPDISGLRPAEPTVPVRSLLFAGWKTGSLCLTVWFAVLYLRLYLLCRRGIPAEPRDFPKIPRFVRVKRLESLSTPITCGVLRPTILLPADFDRVSAETRRVVLAHEFCHIRRGDGLMKLFVLAVAVVHWWNPAVWLYVRWTSRDIELACDRAAVRLLTGKGERTEETARRYARVLLTCAEQRNDHRPALHFGQSPVKERILMLLDGKKTSRLLTVLLMIGMLGTLVCCGPAAETSVNKETEESYAELLSELEKEAAENARLTAELEKQWEDNESLRGLLQERTAEKNELKASNTALSENLRDAEKELSRLEEELPYVYVPSKVYPVTIRETKADATAEELDALVVQKTAELDVIRASLDSLQRMRELCLAKYDESVITRSNLHDQKMAIYYEDGESDESEEYQELEKLEFELWDVECDLARQDGDYIRQIEKLEAHIAEAEVELNRLRRILFEKNAG